MNESICLVFFVEFRVYVLAPRKPMSRKSHLLPSLLSVPEQQVLNMRSKQTIQMTMNRISVAVMTGPLSISSAMISSFCN